MNVGACTFTSTAHQGDCLTLFYAHTYSYQYSTIMAITGYEAIAMIDFNEVTITTVCITCKGYNARSSRHNWCTIVIRNIYSFVECTDSARYRVYTATKWRGNNALARPDTWCSVIRNTTRASREVNGLHSHKILRPTITKDITHCIEAN